MTAVATTTRPAIKARKMEFPFGADIPRHWAGGSVFATAMANSLNLLFPKGERFFVRAVRAFADQLDDRELEAAVRGFIGQEVRHGIEHERFFEVMEAHGIETKPFLELYEKIAYGFLEPSTPKVLRLATTAALEHFTASFAEVALRRGTLDDFVHPTMRDLLKWHAAEEIEHKAVAFDVLKAVDPRYSVRMGGLAIGTAVLVGFWLLGAAMLLAQERELSPRRLVRERIEARKRGNIGLGSIATAIFEYARPGFHPNDKDNDGLARAYLGEIGRLTS